MSSWGKLFHLQKTHFWQIGWEVTLRVSSASLSLMILQKLLWKKTNPLKQLHFDFEHYELSALQCITEITFQIPKVVVHVYTSILFSIDASPQLWRGKISLFIKILQFQKYNKQNNKKNAKRFDPSTKSSSQCFFAPGGPWINVKVLAAAESKASIWLGFNFRDGLMPLGRQRKNWGGVEKSPLSLASLVFCVFGIEKTKGLLVFVDVMRLLHCLFHCCLFRVNQKNKKKNVQHEPTICWHGKLSTKWSFTKIEKWHHYQNNTTRGKSNTISLWY